MENTDILFIKEQAEKILKAIERILENPRLSRVSILELGLSERAKNCLYRRNIKYIEELALLTTSDLMRTRNVGRLVFNEINEKVKGYGLRGWDEN